MLTLRLSFREWSRLVEKPNGLQPARAWLALTERLLASVVTLPTAEQLRDDLLIYGTSAALIEPGKVEHLPPFLWYTGMAIKEQDGLRKARDRALDQWG